MENIRKYLDTLEAYFLLSTITLIQNLFAQRPILGHSPFSIFTPSNFLGKKLLGLKRFNLKSDFLKCFKKLQNCTVPGVIWF